MKFERKVSLLILGGAAAFFVVFIKLFFLQVISAQYYQAAADAQHFYFLEIPARRGEIRFREGFPLVSNKKDYLFYVNLSKFAKDKSLTAQKLGEILVQDVPKVGTMGAIVDQKEQELFLKNARESLTKKMEEKLGLTQAVWVNLAHFVKPETKEKIEELNISGLEFLEEPNRDYPEGSMAAHLLGFVGFDLVGNPKGYFGLEGNYNPELAGRFGQVRQQKDALGRPIAIGSETKKEKQDGRDLITTIDRSVQKFTQKALDEGITTWKAVGGTAIVMDPKNGDILALANFPRYDPANFSYYSNSWYKNPAIANLYEPGSIMKPLVVAAAINENKITFQTKCDKCDGPRQVADATIRTFNNQYNPGLTIPEILINSDNTGMVFIGEKLGFSKLYSYFQQYGFGKKSGIDLQEEEEGSLRKIGDYRIVDQATLTFGQGIAVNAMQMMKAWTALANEGMVVTPRLVTKVVFEDKEIELKNESAKGVLSPQTAKMVTEMLIRVARESPVHFPLDRERSLSDYKIAAKSGTAEIAIGGKYQKTGTIASVIGYFPADNPKFLVYVKLNEPEVRPWGSDTAGPVFAAIAKDLLYYYGISP
jgi:cell division protein FtsI (penicillin-binding protein 3)